MKNYLQCGYEHDCKSKSCLDCKKKYKVNININFAESIAIEDFGTTDLSSWIKNNPKAVDLAQDIMLKLAKKIWNEERRTKQVEGLK
jgi:hypothetical protein